MHGGLKIDCLQENDKLQRDYEQSEARRNNLAELALRLQNKSLKDDKELKRLRTEMERLRTEQERLGDHDIKNDLHTMKQEYREKRERCRAHLNKQRGGGIMAAKRD